MTSRTRTTIRIRKYESTVLRRSFVRNPDDEERENDAESVEIEAARQIETGPVELAESSRGEEQL
jgi:hypothetical protein